MNSRRKFLIRGGLATTALIAANPLESIANASSTVTGITHSNNKITLLHTSDTEKNNPQQQFGQVKALKNNGHNIVLLHAAASLPEPLNNLQYDTSLSQINNYAPAANQYKIIYKGNIKMGVISIAAGEADAVNQINQLSSFLKEKKDCQLVVCLSQLGYKNKKGMDDLKLAAQSEQLDIIIGGDQNNYNKYPFIALGKNKQEVIINHAAEASLALGKIEIEFDKQGKKRHIAFHKHANQLTA